MRVFDLGQTVPGMTPRLFGRAHGESYRPLIKEIAAIRVGLAVESGAFDHRSDVLDAARDHLPLLERYCSSLHDELLGIAEGADVTPEEIVVVNHYTDLKDLRGSERGAVMNRPADDDCSMLYATTGESPLFGQTWDMHGSAMGYVMMMRVPEFDERPSAWLLSIVGCLGMAGLSADGVGGGINNLRCTDAKVGVVWPALVRRALAAGSAESARDTILGATLGSGHHYFFADEAKGFSIEVSGSQSAVLEELWCEEKSLFIHTNHCLSDEIRPFAVVAKDSTTYERYSTLQKALEGSPIARWEDLWLQLGSHEGYPDSVCTHRSSPENPHGIATCAGLVVDFRARWVRAAAGCIHGARPHVFGWSE